MSLPEIRSTGIEIVRRLTDYTVTYRADPPWFTPFHRQEGRA
jgi:hypothetical protein